MDKHQHDTNEGGISLTPTSLNCLCCKFRKNTYHKETKTTTDKDSKTISIVEDRNSYEVGRGIIFSNDFFRPDQMGSIAICDTGWGTGRTSTPEKCDERIEKIVKVFKN